MNTPATEHHDAFKPFVGTFETEVRLWMGPGDPYVMHGSMLNELDLNGTFLKQTYTGKGDDGPFGKFEGRGFWGYNTATNQYEGVWIDNASTMMQTETGTLDGNTWTMTGAITNPQTGKPMTKRTVITLTDDDHHTMETYFTGPDGNEFKSMEIRYTRA